MRWPCPISPGDPAADGCGADLIRGQLDPSGLRDSGLAWSADAWPDAPRGHRMITVHFCHHRLRYPFGHWPTIFTPYRRPQQGGCCCATPFKSTDAGRCRCGRPRAGGWLLVEPIVDRCGQARVQGGTATVALTPGEQFNYIFPLLDDEDAIGANIEYSAYLMWRPLYWFGGPDSVGLNEKYSLADPATVTSAGGKTTATIQLKPYRWSDGQPVTSRDVQFWFNLLKADKANWWGYVSGEIPRQRLRVQDPQPEPSSRSPSPARYSSAWLYNELGQLIPLPQHAWDKESASGPVGNYDLTAAGAQAVYSFLAAQNKDLSTYATNPLWQVIDGPFRLTSYAASTGDATYVRNSHYSGPATGSIHALRVLSYTSDDGRVRLPAVGGRDRLRIPAVQRRRAGVAGHRGRLQGRGLADVGHHLHLAELRVAAGRGDLQAALRAPGDAAPDQPGRLHQHVPARLRQPDVRSGAAGAQPARSCPAPSGATRTRTIRRRRRPCCAPTAGGSCPTARTCARGPGRARTQCGAGITSGAKLSFSLQYSTGSAGSHRGGRGAAVIVHPGRHPAGAERRAVRHGGRGRRALLQERLLAAELLRPGMVLRPRLQRPRRLGHLRFGREWTTAARTTARRPTP